MLLTLSTTHSPATDLGDLVSHDVLDDGRDKSRGTESLRRVHE